MLAVAETFHDVDFDLPAFRDDFLPELARPAPIPTKMRNVEALRRAQKLYTFCKKHKLTRTQTAFVRAYVDCDLDATQAALTVGLSVDERRAAMLGRDLLSRAYINVAVKLLLDYQVAANRFIFDRDKYLRRLDRMAEQNIGDYALVFADGTAEPRLPDPETEREKFDSIKKLKFRTTTKGKGAEREVTNETELELHDPMKATEMLFKYCEPQTSPLAAKVMEDADEFTNWQPTIFEIVEVPEGQFIPAPEPPVIEHIATPG